MTKESPNATVRRPLSRRAGLIAAMVSSCTFGMIPLFAMPCTAAGMDLVSVLIYRFAIASVAMIPLLRRDHADLRLTRGEFARLSLLALLNVLTAVLLIRGYDFMASGPATTIQFSYPVFTCLLAAAFCGERLTPRNAAAIALAVAGVLEGESM